MSARLLKRLAPVAAILGLLALPVAGNAVTVISPSDFTGLRTFDGGANVILLAFPGVKNLGGGSTLEDRTVLHFDISSLTTPVPLTRLKIPVSNIDAGPPDGILEVYSFQGDGTVSTDEWALGTLATTLTGLPGGIQNLFINVTPQLQSAVTVFAPFLSFNLRSPVDADRYNLSLSALGLSPALEVGVTSIPEPTSLLLLGIGSAGLLGRVRARRGNANAR